MAEGEQFAGLKGVQPRHDPPEREECGTRPAVGPCDQEVVRQDRAGRDSGNVVENALPEELDVPIPETMLKFGNNAANDEYAKRTRESG